MTDVVVSGKRVRERDSLQHRGRERRRGLADLIAALSRVLVQRGEAAFLRGAFEETLRQLIGVRAVRLREAGSRWSRASETDGETYAIEVPPSAARTGGMLETSLQPGTPLGAWDCELLKTGAQLAALVLEAERAAGAAARTDAGGPRQSRRDGAAPLIGTTTAMSTLRSRSEQVANTDFTVLREGESGVGKELVARQIHELSARRDGPFVAINCAALVETLLEAELFGIEERTATGVRGRRGKFEHADGGTLFLDEVSDLSVSAQAKLLRAIQELAVERVGGQGTRAVNIRIVAATNRGLRDMVERRLFRADLYYRLGGVDIHVPSLRERRPDIRELAAYFLDRHRQTRRLRLSEGALLALLNYDWPGNVRELERVIERVVALAADSTIELDDLPARIRGDYERVLMPSVVANESLRVWAARYSRIVLERCQGNKRRAARDLGISYHTLQTYLDLAARIHGPAAAEALPPADPASETALAGQGGL